MIKVNGLTKDYGARRAVHNLSFDAQQGEIVGFLGPNGAGKTTTMRILTGYMPPTDGEAIVAGYDGGRFVGSAQAGRLPAGNRSAVSRYGSVRLSEVHGRTPSYSERR